MDIYWYKIPAIEDWFGVIPKNAVPSAMLEDLVDAAEAAFAGNGWDMSAKSGPYFFAIPDVTAVGIGYLVQQNDGAVYIGSEYSFPHLEAVATAHGVEAAV